MIDVYSWGWPQFAYVALTIMGIGICANRNGTMKEGRHNFWSDLFSSVPAWALLFFGGFFA